MRTSAYKGGGGIDTLSIFTKQKLISFLHTSCNIFTCKKHFMWFVTKVAVDISIAEYFYPGF